MEPSTQRPRPLYLVLVAIVLATLPCYCAGLIAIRRAPGEATPTPVVTPTLTASVSPALPSETPIPGPTLTPSITQTLLVFTPSTATPSPTQTPVPTDTPMPTSTDTLIPSDTPTPTDTPTPG